MHTDPRLRNFVLNFGGEIFLKIVTLMTILVNERIILRWIFRKMRLNYENKMEMKLMTVVFSGRIC
jgi:hypothetical protein